MSWSKPIRNVITEILWGSRAGDLTWWIPMLLSVSLGFCYWCWMILLCCRECFLADRTIGRAFGTVCRVSSVVVCLSSVTFCIVAKRNVLAKNCLKEWIGSQDQKVDFFGRRRISTSGFAATATEMAVFCLMYCGETVRPSKKVSEGVNRKPGSKSSFFGSPPYFYFRFRHYGYQDGRFCLIFARTAKQLVLDGTNGLSSRKPCAYCWIAWSELKP